MKTVDVVIGVPIGNYCDGCPLMFNTEAIKGWIRGCNYVHCELKTEGDFDQKTVKDKKCPTLDKSLKVLVNGEWVRPSKELKTSVDGIFKSLSEHEKEKLKKDFKKQPKDKTDKEIGRPKQDEYFKGIMEHK